MSLLIHEIEISNNMSNSLVKTFQNSIMSLKYVCSTVRRFYYLKYTQTYW